MLKFSASLTMLFGEADFLARFEKAAQSGFKGVEFMFPYDFSVNVLEGRLNRHSLELVLFNLPAGDWAAGERGIACLPDRVAEFREGVERAAEYARALKCSRVNCLSGISPKDRPIEAARDTLIDNLRWAASLLEQKGIRLLVEAINTRDMPGFYLNHSRQALELIAEVDHPNLLFQFDIYHMQVMEGDLTRSILDNLGKIGHVQVADNPGRHEPGTGEINFTNLLRSIDEAGYEGWVGCEYKPARKTEAGLAWMQPFLRSPAFRRFDRRKCSRST